MLAAAVLLSVADVGRPSVGRSDRGRPDIDALAVSTLDKALVVDPKILDKMLLRSVVDAAAGGPISVADAAAEGPISVHGTSVVVVTPGEADPEIPAVCDGAEASGGVLRRGKR